MLWTDRLPITVADVALIDPESPQVATSEKTLLSDRIAHAYQEATAELFSATQSYNASFSPDVSALHLGAVLGRPYSSSEIMPCQVVVDSRNPGIRSPLQLWLAWKTLVSLYEYAFGRSVSPRYEGKLVTVSGRVREAWINVWNSGIPCVYAGLSAPAALYEKSGSFALSSVAAVGAPAGTFKVAITYSAGSVESHPSAEQTITTTSGNGIRVDISGLTPPAGYQYLAPTHWNVYAGTGTLYRQVASIPITTLTADLGASLLASGPTPPSGQAADRTLILYHALNNA